MSREVILSRITLAVAHRMPLKFVIESGRILFISGFFQLNQSNSTALLAWQSVTLTTDVELLTDTQCN